MSHKTKFNKFALVGGAAIGGAVVSGFVKDSAVVAIICGIVGGVLGYLAPVPQDNPSVPSPKPH